MDAFTKVDNKRLNIGDIVPDKEVGRATGYMHFIWHGDVPIVTEPITIEKTYVQADTASAYSADCRSLYDTFARESMIAPWRYLGRCRADGKINEDMRIAPYIYICSAFRTDDEDEAFFRSRLVMAACRHHVRDFGQIPVAPHLYFPTFLDERTHERKIGMTIGRRLLEVCSGITAYTIKDEITEGMQEELELAASLGMTPVIVNLTRDAAEEFIYENLG